LQSIEKPTGYPRGLKGAQVPVDARLASDRRKSLWGADFSENGASGAQLVQQGGAAAQTSFLLQIDEGALL
jgi:hypothetical protein